MQQVVGKSSGAAGSALLTIAQAAIEQNRPIQSLAQGTGVDLPRYRALPAAPPLCFFHIPKTAGASVTAWMRSMFAPEDIAPYVTQGEYERLSSASRNFQLYAGRISGRLMRHMPRGMQIFTINPRPGRAGHFRIFLDKGALPATAGDQSQCSEDQELHDGRGEGCSRAWTRRQHSRRIRRQCGTSSATGSCTSLPASRARMRSRNCPRARRSCRRLRTRQLQRAVRLLNCFDVVGDYADVEGASLLMAALRGWSSPPLLPRIHDLRAPTRASSPRTRLFASGSSR